MFKGKVLLYADRTPLYDAELSQKLVELAEDYFDEPDFEHEAVSIVDDLSHDGNETYVTLTLYANDDFFLELMKRDITIECFASDLVKRFNNQCDVMGEWHELDKQAEYLENVKFELCELAEMCDEVQLFNKFYTAIHNFVHESAWDKAVSVQLVSTERWKYEEEEGE